MNLRILALFNLLIILILSFTSYLFWNGNIKSKSEKKNIVDRQEIAWGKEWKNGKSKYSGSELRFSILNTKTVSLKADVPNPEPEQEVEITLEGKAFYLTSPDLAKKELTIHLSKNSYNKPQDVKIRFFCSNQFYPCNVTIKSIYVDGIAKLMPAPLLPKTLAILGDSISANYLSKNYSRFLVDHLGYRLHNSSFFGSTITKSKNGKNALSLYEKDVVEFAPEIVLINMGTNDILNEVSQDKFRASYLEIIQGIKKKSAETKIFSAGILPSPGMNIQTVNDFNSIIESIANSENIVYISQENFLSDSDYADSIHPTLAAQDKLTKGFLKVFSAL